MSNDLALGNLQQIIKDNFDKLKDLDYRELMKMKIDPKDLYFSTKPAKFESFFTSKKFFFFVYDLICYCKLLVDIEARQKLLEKETKQRGLEAPKSLRADTQAVRNKGRNLALKYSLILMDFMADKSKQVFLDYTSFKKENELYEILILLSVKITQVFFEESSHQMIEEETHRLLRSGAFNESRRKNFELEKIKKFPALEETSGKEPFDATVNKLLKRSHLPNVNWEFHYYNQRSDVKPNFTKMKPFEALNSRSPLLSLVIPSVKFKLHDFDKTRKDKISSILRPRSNTRQQRSNLNSIIERAVPSRKEATGDYYENLLNHDKDALNKSCL